MWIKIIFIRSNQLHFFHFIISIIKTRLHLISNILCNMPYLIIYKNPPEINDQSSIIFRFFTNFKYFIFIKYLKPHIGNVNMYTVKYYFFSLWADYSIKLIKG